MQDTSRLENSRAEGLPGTIIEMFMREIGTVEGIMAEEW